MGMPVKYRFYLVALAGLGFLALPTGSLQAGLKESATVEAACEVLDSLADIPLKGIPPALLKDAQGVAIVPGVIKAGFVVGGRFGRGVFLVRGQGDCWSRPVFITIT